MLVHQRVNGDFPIKNGDFPIKNGDFPIKNGDFPIKNCDFPIKHGDFPLFWSMMAHPSTQGNVRAKWDTVRRKAKLARQSVSLQTLAAERLFALFTGNREGFFTEIPNGIHSIRILFRKWDASQSNRFIFYSRIVLHRKWLNIMMHNSSTKVPLTKICIGFITFGLLSVFLNNRLYIENRIPSGNQTRQLDIRYEWRFWWENQL